MLKDDKGKKGLNSAMPPFLTEKICGAKAGQSIIRETPCSVRRN